MRFDSLRKYIFFRNWSWPAMTGLVVAWLAVWGILLKVTLDRGLEAASALCGAPQATDCNVLVAIDWKPLYLPLAGLLLILLARWWGSDRRGSASRAA